MIVARDTNVYVCGVGYGDCMASEFTPTTAWSRLVQHRITSIRRGQKMAANDVLAKQVSLGVHRVIAFNIAYQQPACFNLYYN